METLYEDEKVRVARETNGRIRITNKLSESGGNYLIVIPESNGDIGISAPNSDWRSVADGYDLTLHEYPQ